MPRTVDLTKPQRLQSDWQVAMPSIAATYSALDPVSCVTYFTARVRNLGSRMPEQKHRAHRAPWDSTGLLSCTAAVNGLAPVAEAGLNRERE
jgi:hypothetical protein